MTEAISTLIFIFVMVALAIGKRKQTEEMVTGKCMHSHCTNNICDNCDKVYKDDKD